MLSVLHSHLVCIEVAGVFSSEYDTLLVVYFPPTNLPFIGVMLANVGILATVYILINVIRIESDVYHFGIILLWPVNL
jgi:hypothetical protein